MVLAWAGALLFVPAVLASQAALPAAPSHPEVINLTLKGVKVVKQSDLLQSISTTSSHCNGFVLVPFCWISKSKYFYTKNYLDHKELERDVLRVRVFYWKRGYREADCVDLTNWICDVLDAPGDAGVIAKVREKVTAQCKVFPVYG